MANKEQWVHNFFFKSGLWWARKLLQNEFSKSRLWFCEQKNTKHPSCSVFSYQYTRCPRTRAPEKKGEISVKTSFEFLQIDLIPPVLFKLCILPRIMLANEWGPLGSLALIVFIFRFVIPFGYVVSVIIPFLLFF
jgi:hypothetical protein